ncbi:YrhA family protein [Oceanobacillus timonensis]|uniref:YrhA family protein n=1 Tax=Oceanobacillus timonensis TaxID=1926285 RepID=UPI0009BADF20|nr:YrhA family protein [Oceanobacillus timonensis]
MVSRLLAEIEKIKSQDGETMKFPASNKDIQSLKEWISRNVRENLWINEYGSFLEKVNGLEFNGLVIYNGKSSDENKGFIKSNEIWRDSEWDNDYLFFGDSSISWYCMDSEKCVFLELDKPSGDIIEEYNNFEEMVTGAIKSVL